MSNIIEFPVKSKPSRQAAPPLSAMQPVAAHNRPKPGASRLTLFEHIMRIIWLLVTLTWPLVSGMSSLYVFFQFLRMLYYWNTPGSHAGWSFLAHFAALVFLICFTTLYKPKGID